MSENDNHPEAEQNVEEKKINNEENEDTNKENEEPKEEGKKTDSIFTIFSIWNTMIGSSTVSMPKAISKAGIIPTIIVKTGIRDKDYCDTIFRYFGRGKIGQFGKTVQIIFNLGINIGATFIYFIIINQNLYPCLAFFCNKIFKTHLDEGSIKISFKYFSIVYCGMLIGIAVFPLLIMKNMGTIVKLNSFGIYFISFLLLFVFSIGIYSLSNTHYEFKNIVNPGKGHKTKYLYLFNSDAGSLAGVLSLGFFSHSFILPVMRNNKNQKNNKRDLIIGYILVMCTYLVIGTMGYIGFSGKKFASKFEDNWFRFFPTNNPWMIILRLINVVQLLTIFPMLFYIIRIQFFGTFWKSEYPGQKHVIIFSISLLTICIIVLITCADKLLKLMGIIGATCSTILVYTFPLLVNIKYYRRKHPDNLDELNLTEQKDIFPLLQDKTFSEEEENNIKSQNHIPSDIPIVDYRGISKKPKNIVKEYAFYTSQYIVIAFGIFVFILQFVHINFFGVHLKDKP